MGSALATHAGHPLRDTSLRISINGQVGGIRQQDRYMEYRCAHLLASLREHPLRDSAAERPLQDSTDFIIEIEQEVYFSSKVAVSDYAKEFIGGCL